MRPMALHHNVNQVCACFERAHHACSRLVEHAVGHMVEEVALELEVDDEVHMSPHPHWCERPRVCQVLQRSSVSSANGIVKLFGHGRTGVCDRARHTDSYARAATPVTSAQVWKAWVRAARYWVAGR